MSEPLPSHPADGESSSIEYLGRVSVLEKLCRYRIDGAMLSIQPQDAARPPATPPPLGERIPLQTVSEVRLRFFPTRVQTNRYECILTLRNGRSLKFTNEEYRGVLNFHDRSAEYCRFVRGLSAAVAAANPAATFLTGRPWLAQSLEWGFLGAMVLFLALVLWLVGRIELHTFVVVKIGLIAAFVPVLVQYARKNRPATYEPHAVPAKVLPPAAR